MKSLYYFYSLYSELMTAWSSFYQVGGSIEYTYTAGEGGAGGQNHLLFAAVFFIHGKSTLSVRACVPTTQ